MSRTRGYCFTLNNYSEEDIQHLNDIKCQYLVYGKEVASSGTPHLQGYVHFTDNKTFSACKKVLGNKYHIEARIGTIVQAIEYCKKDGNHTERGRIAQEPVRFDQCKTYSQVLKVKFDLTHSIQPRFQPSLVYWFYGETGTGKSRTAYDMINKDSFYSKNSTKWWDGYIGQDDVIIDDINVNAFTFRFLLNLFDRYPLLIEYKGGTCNFNSKRIFITNTYNPEHYWQDEDLRQILRRIKEVRLFSKNIFLDSSIKLYSGIKQCPTVEDTVVMDESDSESDIIHVKAKDGLQLL